MRPNNKIVDISEVCELQAMQIAANLLKRHDWGIHTVSDALKIDARQIIHWITERKEHDN